MISVYDYFIIASYLLVTLATGLLFRRLSKNTSDYFRCGGSMPWWLTGASAWITSFSAWTFTGAAGKVYETGTLVLMSYYGTGIGLLLVWAYTGVRFRRLRVVTYMEAVRLRFDSFTEQFYTWLKLPLLLVFSAVGLNTIGVFMASVFHVEMPVMLLVLGGIVTLMTFFGGAWAVLASDFVQLFLVLTITLVVAFLALKQPAIGGLANLIHKLPAEHFNWSLSERWPILSGWILVMIFFGFYNHNKLENATTYLMAKSDRDAKRMVLIPLIGSFIGPLIWLIPSLVARITHPDLMSEYPQLSHPHEAAFVAVCLDVMPQGLLGVLLCAMLGATLTAMDASLNKGAGIFVRSFYRPILRPSCSESEMLSAGKICTLCFGVIGVVLAIAIEKLRTVGLFDLSNQLAGSIAVPLALPLLLGFFYLKTPAWSAWTTVALGFLVSWLVWRTVTPDRAQYWFGGANPLSDREVTDVMLVCSVAANVVVPGAWFFLTGRFYPATSAANRASVDEFRKRLETPVEDPGANLAERTVLRLLGWLCGVFGTFIVSLIVIPNNTRGRLCFIACGGLIALVGAILLWSAKKMEGGASKFQAARSTP